MAGGQAVTSGQGSVVQSEALALAGQQISGATGTIVADAGAGIAVSGAEASAAVGAAAITKLVGLRSRKVGGGEAARTVTGSSFGSAVGSLLVVPMRAMSGASASASAGAFGKSRTRALSGSSTTAQTGLMSTPGSFSGLQADWLNRSTAAAIIHATKFDTAAKVNNYRFTDGFGHDPNPAPGSLGSYCRRDPTGGIMGDGALELEQLTNGNMAAVFWFPFDSSYTTYQYTDAGYNRGPGQPFYMQVRFKSNCVGVNGTTGGGGRKQFSVSRLMNSYTLQEIVVQDTEYRGAFQMYQGMGTGGEGYKGFEEAAGRSDFNLQPGSAFSESGGPGYCSFQNLPDTTDCWVPSNEWETYLLHVVPATDNQSNGHVAAWVWEPTRQQYLRIMFKRNLYMTYDTDKADGFNAAILWIYETGRVAGPSNQKQWYDELILSTQPIPRPQPTALPTEGLSVGAWTQIGNALSTVDPSPTPAGVTGPQGKISAWNGFAVDPITGHPWLVAAGGHNDYAGNEVNRIRLDVANPVWEQVLAPTPAAQVLNASAYYSDGRPTSRHHFYGVAFSSTARKVVLFGGAWWSSEGNFFNDVAGYNVDTNTYDANGVHSNMPGAFGGDVFSCCEDSNSGHIYLFQDFQVARWHSGTFATSILSPGGVTPPAGQNGPTAFDHTRNRILMVGGQYTHRHFYDTSANSFSQPTLTGTAASAVQNCPAGSALVYVQALDSYLLRDNNSGGTIYRITASGSTLTCTTFSTTGGSSIPTVANNDGSSPNGPYSKFVYIPHLKGCYFVPRHNAAGWFIRVH